MLIIPGLDPDGIAKLEPLAGFGNVIGNVDSTGLGSRWDDKA